MSETVIRHLNDSRYRSPNATGKLRVGFVASALDAGGSEIWMASLARNCPSVHWAGCAHVGVKYMQPWVIEDLASLMPVYSHVFDQFEGSNKLPMTRLECARDAIEAVARHSDVLIVWGVTDLAHYLAPEYDGRVVLVSHCAEGELSNKILSSSHDRATDLVAVSRAAAKSFPAGASPIIVLHNGADERRLVPTISRKETRERMGFSESDIVVGFIGRMTHTKRPEDVYRAVKILNNRQRSKTHKCWYVGAGLTGSLKREATRALGDNVVFTDAVTNVGDIYQALDCFVLTSETEGCSLAVLEAWLAGVPTVLSSVGFVPEAIELHGELSQIASCGDAEGIADGIQKAIADYNRPIVEHSKRIAKEHYTAAKMGSRWERFLGEAGASVCRDYCIAIKPKIVVGILSAIPYRDRRDVCRSTWLTAVKHHDNLDAVFLIGDSAAGEPVRRDDLLLLSCNDNYDHLSHKTGSLCRWALANCQFDYLFKCDDDTFVDLERLLSIDFGGRDYIGFEFYGNGYASGGAGYLLSRKAAKIIAEQLHEADWKEDVLVADRLRKNGIVISHDERFVPYGDIEKRPKPDNDIITSHRLPRDLFLATHKELART